MKSKNATSISISNQEENNNNNVNTNEISNLITPIIILSPTSSNSNIKLIEKKKKKQTTNKNNKSEKNDKQKKKRKTIERDEDDDEEEEIEENKSEDDDEMKESIEEELTSASPTSSSKESFDPNYYTNSINNNNNTLLKEPDQKRNRSNSCISISSISSISSTSSVSSPILSPLSHLNIQNYNENTEKSFIEKRKEKKELEIELIRQGKKRNFNTIPNHLLLIIFSYLPVYNLPIITRVCSGFHSILKDRKLWKVLDFSVSKHYNDVNPLSGTGGGNFSHITASDMVRIISKSPHMETLKIFNMNGSSKLNLTDIKSILTSCIPKNSSKNKNLKYLSFCQLKIQDTIIQHTIKSFKNLQKIKTNRSNITSNSINLISKNYSDTLTALDIQNTEINDDSISELIDNCKKLNYLKIIGTSVGYESMLTFSQLQSLNNSEVNLSDLNIREGKALSKLGSNIKTLAISERLFLSQIKPECSNSIEKLVLSCANNPNIQKILSMTSSLKKLKLNLNDLTADQANSLIPTILNCLKTTQPKFLKSIEISSYKYIFAKIIPLNNNNNNNNEIEYGFQSLHLREIKLSSCLQDKPKKLLSKLISFGMSKSSINLQTELNQLFEYSRNSLRYINIDSALEPKIIENLITTKSIPNLFSLTIAGARFKKYNLDSFFIKLASQCPNLYSIRIHDGYVTDSSIFAISSNCPKLSIFGFGFDSVISKKAMLQLLSSTEISYLKPYFANNGDTNPYSRVDF